MLDLLIKNAQVVVLEAGVEEVNVGIKDGRIVSLVSPAEKIQASRVIDARGLWVFPGLVDPHGHYGVYNDLAHDFAVNSQFAAAGGVTTVVNFFRTPGSYLETLPPAIRLAEEHSLIDYAFHLAILTGQHVREMSACVEKMGVTSFKFFMGYKGVEKSRFGSDRTIDDAFLVEIFDRMGGISDRLVLCVHCENADLSRQLKVQKAGAVPNTLAGFESLSPGFVETEALVRTLYLASQYGVRIYIVHLSAASSAEVLSWLPWFNSERVTIETCPHYLTIDTGCAAGLLALVRPPVRNSRDVEALWKAIRRGQITAIGSDECPNYRANKFKNGENIDTPVVGFGGMGLILPLMLTEGYFRRGIALEMVAALTSMNPAKTFGLYPAKGALMVGADADLVLVDPARRRTVRAQEMVMASDYSVYEGMELRGWPVMTISRGEIIFENGELRGSPGRGKYLFRQA